MAPAVERRERIGRGLSDRSKSPVKTRHSPKGRSSPQRERLPRRRRSTSRTRSPKRAGTSHRKSPLKEKVPDGVRLSKHVRGRSPVRTSSSPSPSPRSKRLRRVQAEREPEKVIPEEHTKESREEHSKGRERESREKEKTNHSRSLSPRSKRLMRAQAEKQAEKSKEREHGRNTSREERDRGRHGERVEAKEEHGRNTNREERDRGRHGERVEAKEEHGRNTSRDEHDRGRHGERVEAEEHGRNTNRDERDRGRHGERGESKDTLSARRSTRDKSDGGSSWPSRRDRSVSPERRGRSVSPEDRNHRSKHGSRSPTRGSKAGAREEASKSRSTEQFRDSDLDSVAKMKAAEESLEAKDKDKQKPSFELSGKLAEETNRVGGVTLLFNEPPDARKPDTRWRLYVFKAGEVLNEPLYVHRQSCYLFGRERRVADIPTDHPSCSKQHAVIQYRQVEKEQPDGLMSKQVRPYIMDLGSTNGTFINDNRIEPQRYYELFEKDTIRFGNSSREYVILHENSAE